jgi:hypothetical protein
LCQSDRISPGFGFGLMVTSSLLTGRALEKARFFLYPPCGSASTRSLQNPVDGLDNPP